MSSDKTLSGKRIVITGASMGIGRAVALELASQGARLVLNSSGGANGDPEALIGVIREITEAGGAASYTMGSVADFEFSGELITNCVDLYGGIDGLINIAGVAEPAGSSILDISADDWQRVIGVHLNGTFNTCRHAAPIMKAQGSGCIVNTGSHAFLGIYGGTGYAAAKGGINSLTAAIAKDLAQYGIRCNVVNPGAKTRLSSGEEFERNMRQLHQRGLLDDKRLQSALTPAAPSAIASLYTYLMGSLSGHINGQILSASGRHLGQFPWQAESILAYREDPTGAPWQITQITDRFRDVQ